MAISSNITLGAAAGLFSVHPRTIVRALTGEHNTYWYEDSNEDIYPLKTIGEAYDLTELEMKKLVQSRDKLLTPVEAAEVLGVHPRTFRNRVKNGKYRKIKNGRIVRYLNSEIVSDKIARE